MQIEGYGYEYYATYIGGPADGLDASVVLFENKKPSEVSCVELNNLIESHTLLGSHFFKKKPSQAARVGVYMLEKDPDNYHVDELFVYQFIEMTDYKTFLIKYGEKNA